MSTAWTAFPMIGGNELIRPLWCERRDRYELAIDLPGFRKRDITVEVTGEVLEVRAKREPGLWSTERRAAHHAIMLPAFADSTRASADFHAGRLVIRVEKQEAAKARVIPIRVNGQLPSPRAPTGERTPAKRVLDGARKAWRDAVELVVAGFRWPIPHD